MYLIVVKLLTIGTIIGFLFLCFVLFNFRENFEIKDSQESFVPKALKLESSCSRVCLSKACIYTVRDLLESVDSKASFCDDFYEFSCGNYLSKQEDSIIQGMHDSLRLRIRNLILNPNLSNTPNMLKNALSQLRNMYDNCLMKEYDEKVAFADFMRIVTDHGMDGWPNLPQNWSFPNEDVYSVLSRFNVFNADGPILIRNPQSSICDRNSVSDFNCTVKFQAIITESSLLLQNKVYLSANKVSWTQVESYLSQIVTVLSFFGAEKEDAENSALDIFEFESKIAVYFNHSSMRRYNSRMASGDIPDTPSTQKLITRLQVFVETFLRESGVPVAANDVVILFRDIVMAEKIVALIDNTAHKTIANYILVRLALNYASELGYTFRKTLSGGKVQLATNRYPESKENWKACIDWCWGNFDTLLGLSYSTEYFDSTNQVHIESLFNILKGSLIEIVNDINHFSDDFKKYLVEKILKNRIEITRYTGHIPSWLSRYYKTLEFRGKSFFQNIIEYYRQGVSTAMQSKYHQERIEYLRSFLLINARVNMNSVNVGLGMMQYPMVDFSRPPSINIAKIGHVLAHELAHVLYLAVLVHRDMSDETKLELVNYQFCLISKYTHYKDTRKNAHLDGNFTFIENFCDNIAVKTLHRAYFQTLAKETSHLPKVLNMSDDQLVFLHFAQPFCEHQFADKKLNRKKLDPHSPYKYRVIGPLSNFDSFAEAFECEKRTFMNPQDKCYFTKKNIQRYVMIG